MAVACTFLMESGCDCWALRRSRCCQCGKRPLEEMGPSGVLHQLGGVPGHMQQMPTLDVKVSQGVKKCSEVPGQEIRVFFFFMTHFVSVKHLLSP